MNKTPNNKSLNKSNTLFKYFSKSPATASPNASGSKVVMKEETKKEPEEQNVRVDGKICKGNEKSVSEF